jgi:hypothetical protein
LPRPTGLPKTGGRQAGTPNKATRDVKAFLERVFTAAFNDPLFEARLTQQIVELTVDTKLLQTLLAYYAGAPTRQVAHEHSGAITLAQIIAGTVTSEDDGDER